MHCMNRKRNLKVQSHHSVFDHAKSKIKSVFQSTGGLYPQLTLSKYDLHTHTILTKKMVIFCSLMPLACSSACSHAPCLLYYPLPALLPALLPSACSSPLLAPLPALLTVQLPPACSRPSCLLYVPLPTPCLLLCLLYAPLPALLPTAYSAACSTPPYLLPSLQLCLLFSLF